MVSDIEECVFYNDCVKNDLIGDISGTFGKAKNNNEK